MENLKEFKVLILKYESITLEEIEKTEDNKALGFGKSKAKEITGFGYGHTCTLCLSAGSCSECTWGYEKEEEHCASFKNKGTYDEIKLSETNKELLKAFKKRAEHMRKHLKEKGIDFKD